jgi:hypothetical protein
VKKKKKLNKSLHRCLACVAADEHLACSAKRCAASGEKAKKNKTRDKKKIKKTARKGVMGRRMIIIYGREDG